MITPEDFTRLAGRFPSLKRLPPEIADRLVREVEAVQVPSGTRIFAEGDSCRSFVALLEGSVRVSKLSESGRELLLYFVRPGDFCILSVSCLLGGAEFPAQGTATENLDGINLPGPLFESLVEHCPDFRHDVFALMGDRLGNMLRLVEEVAFLRLDQRLASLLLQRSEGNEDPILATHQELADDLGSSREIVSRILESFELEGWIELGRKRIVLLERHRLERAAGDSSPPRKTLPGAGS